MKKILIGIAATLTILPMLAFAQVGDVAPISTAACVSITHDLQYRSRDAQTGGDVSTLQDFLQSQGYLNSEPTGYFGLLTQSAVKSYQKANGILNSGYFGPITRGKLVSALCAGNNSNAVNSANTNNGIVNTPKTALCPNGMLLSNNCKTAVICAPGVLYNTVTGALCSTVDNTIPSITISYPQTGYSLDTSGGKGSGTAYSPIATIQWNEQNGNYPVNISLLNQSNQIVKIIAQNAPDTGSYIWSYDPTLVNGNYQIKIEVAYSGKTVAAYSGFFTATNSIVSGATTITVVYPQAGNSLDASGGKGSGPGYSSIANIQWSEQNGDYPVSIYLLNQNNQVVREIAVNIPDTGSYVWAYDPTLPDGSYRIRVDVLYPADKGGQDYADSGYFTTAGSPISQPAVQPTITVTYPQAGNIMDNGGKATIANIQWTSSAPASSPVDIDLINTSGVVAKNIAQSVSNTGSYSWLSDPTVISGTYRIRIAFSKGAYTPFYGGYFSITSSLPSIRVISPNGGELLNFNKGTGSINIQWTSANASSNSPVGIALVNANNTVVQTIAQSISNTGNYTWVGDTTIPNGQYKISVYFEKGDLVQDYSDSSFTIQNY